MMKKHLLVIFTLLMSSILRAQTGNYNIYNLSTENGLPTNDYQTIYQDSYGFLWLASYDGLFRWDGYSYKKYYHDEKNTKSLNNNIVYSIFEDSKKRLWVGTIEGLNLYDREADGFIKCTIRKKGERIPVNAILEDSHQRLWLGTSNGLCMYDENKPQWFYNQTNEDVIFCLTVDANDNIWAGTFGMGVREFVQSTKTFKSLKHINGDTHSIASNKIKSILADREGRIWVGTEDKGITVLNSGGDVLSDYNNFPNEKPATQNSINCLYQDKANTIWIGVGREALYYMNEHTSQPAQLTGTIHNNTQNRFLSISSIREDNFGNIWFATTGNGLFYTNRNKNIFENYLQNPAVVKGLETSVITCFYEDNKGYVWMGTDRGGLLKFDPVKNSFINYTAITNALSSNAINDIKGDEKGILWIATWGGGIMQFNPANNSVKSYLHDAGNDNSLIYNDAKAILPDDSLVWIGSHGEGITAFDKKNDHFINYKNNGKFGRAFPFNMNEPAWINHLFKDSQKRLWISTYSGVYVFDGKKLQHFEHTKDTSSISSNSVNMVTEDRNGKIWVISEFGGLDMFDEKNKKFIRLTEKYNLPETMKGIVADDNGLLWISSNEGIIAFNPQTFAVKRFDASDGLQGNTFFHKAVLKKRNGQLYFGGPRGFNVFNPATLKPINIPTYFYFTDLYVNNELQKPAREASPLKKVLPFTNELTLTSSQSFFSVEFVAINLYSPAKTQYAYMMDGLHNQWINLNAERKISFTNLDAGSYHLKVRYTGVDGEWHIAPNPLHIIILPPWWQTWWFELSMAILLVASTVAVFYLRVASIKNRNRFLKAEVEKRTHELNEINSFLVEQNDEIKIQKERLEISNEEIVRQADKILDQQEHIITQNQALESTVSELQKLNTAKDHFFSILAHDLKNPVSAMTDISDFMKNNFLRMDRKEVQKYLTSIHTSSNAVYELLINLLNWSRSQSKKIEYQPTDVNLWEVVYKNVRLLEQQFNNKQIHLSLDINITHGICADYNMIDAAIRNILSNSIKFTNYNGHVIVRSTEERNEVTICIADDGVGMSREQKEKLFSIDKTNVTQGTAGEKGTGLGLVITNEFIQVNKGTLIVESEPGNGTAFYITLPKSSLTVKLAAVKEHTRHLTPANVSLDFWETFPVDKLIKIKGKKILIVDDNKDLRDYLKLILSGTFEIFEAENGKEGLKLALEIQPVAIISDLIMPVMNGFQFCKEIKNSTSTSHIPVIFLTSQWEENTQLSGYEASADVYLTKPVKKELLIQVIINFIRNQEQLHEKLHENTPANGLYPEGLTLNKLDEEFLHNIVALIETDISDPNMDARSICREMGISRTVLYSKIKTLTGQSVHEFIKSVRLKKSLKFLHEGKLNINQIAFEVGFNSHSYFDKCFVKQYGMGPKEYINKKKSFIKNSS